MKTVKRLWFAGCLVLAMCMLICGFGMNTQVVNAKAKLNKTDITLSVGKTSQLKVSGTKKKIKWSSNKKSVAAVSSSGKVTAKKKGTAVITAKAGSKKLTCKVTVKKAEKAEQVLELVNKERKKRGLSKVHMDTKLKKAANLRAKEISEKFDHIRPNGKNCFSVLAEYDIGYYAAGENIAAGRSTAKAIMNSWMHSDGHRANILNPDFKKLGVGYQKIEKSAYTYYWVEIFTD